MRPAAANTETCIRTSQHSPHHQHKMYNIEKDRDRWTMTHAVTKEQKINLLYLYLCPFVSANSRIPGLMTLHDFPMSTKFQAFTSFTSFTSLTPCGSVPDPRSDGSWSWKANWPVRMRCPRCPRCPRPGSWRWRSKLSKLLKLFNVDGFSVQQPFWLQGSGFN